ncbi:RNA polymerase sigma factor [Egicoccus sp. AB-alg6-2]|uniref:RNA polymerase sigma factor n=1 Tax=Egicoccus sp. AB-alg6-2 TaxID=3242692 RepID=UPI00359EFD30
MDVDPELVRAVQRGDAGAMDDLVRASYTDVYRLCHRLLGDPADAADATQEVFVRVMRSVVGFRADSAFGTWLHRVTLNVCATALRRRGDARARGQAAGSVPFEPDEQVVDGADTAGEVAARDQAGRVAAAIARLPPVARDVVVLRHVRGLSTKEAARMLDISETACKVRLHRAHARLRDLLDEGDVD